jgi:hypothetical protein
MKKEIWKNVKGFESYYQISNFGRVKSLKRKWRRKTRIMKSSIQKDTGYKSIQLFKNGGSKFYRIHRLVALHFISNPENKPEVNHIDCNKLNNCYNNLEWVTPKENMKHALLNGIINCGEKVFLSKLKESDILEIRKLYPVFTQKEIGAIFGVHKTTIRAILSKRTWGHVL